MKTDDNGLKDGYSIYNTYMSWILSSTRPNWLFLYQRRTQYPYRKIMYLSRSASSVKTGRWTRWTRREQHTGRVKFKMTPHWKLQNRLAVLLFKKSWRGVIKACMQKKREEMVKKRFLREMNFESEASEPALMSKIVFLVCQGEGKILEVCFCSEPISQSNLLLHLPCSFLWRTAADHFITRSRF